jgi:quercetin dioxygenase-like cupin family protein/ketosteroid isomerase-like protein
MRIACSVAIALSLLFLVGTAGAQDPAKVGPNIYKCTFENERARLCEIRFKPGDSIPVHSHPDHIVYVISGGKLRITPVGGAASDVEFKPGQVIWIPAEAHSGVNIGSTDVRGLVIELKDPAHMDSTAQALMQMERDWAKAMMSGDNATMDRIIASDWVLTDPMGHRTSRAEAVADLRSGALKFESTVALDMEVRVFGDTALVSGRTRDKGKFKGQDISGDYRFTDVFVKRDGRWQAVSTHVTKVAP